MPVGAFGALCCAGADVQPEMGEDTAPSGPGGGLDLLHSQERSRGRTRDSVSDRVRVCGGPHGPFGGAGRLFWGAVRRVGDLLFVGGDIGQGQGLSEERCVGPV